MRFPTIILPLVCVTISIAMITKTVPLLAEPVSASSGDGAGAAAVSPAKAATQKVTNGDEGETASRDSNTTQPADKHDQTGSAARKEQAPTANRLAQSMRERPQKVGETEVAIFISRNWLITRPLIDGAEDHQVLLNALMVTNRAPLMLVNVNGGKAETNLSEEADRDSSTGATPEAAESKKAPSGVPEMQGEQHNVPALRAPRPATITIIVGADTLPEESSSTEDAVGESLPGGAKQEKGLKGTAGDGESKPPPKNGEDAYLKRAQSWSEAGFHKEAKEQLGEYLKGTPTADLAEEAPDLRYLGEGVFWYKLNKWVERYATQIIATIGYLFALIVVGLALWRVGNALCIRRISVNQSLLIENIGTDGLKDDYRGKGFSFLIQNKLNRITNEPPPASFKFVTSVIKTIDIPEDVSTKLPSKAPGPSFLSPQAIVDGFAAVLNWLFRSKTLKLQGQLHETDALGMGLSLRLLNPDGSTKGSETFWLRELEATDEPVMHGAGDQLDLLAEVAAVWLLFQRKPRRESGIVPEQELLGAKEWKSYARFRVALRAERKRCYSAAKAIYVEILQEDPGFHGARLNLGHCCVRLGLSDMGIDQLSRAIDDSRNAAQQESATVIPKAIDPTVYMASYSIGTCYHNLGKFEEAEKRYRELLDELKKDSDQIASSDESWKQADSREDKFADKGKSKDGIRAFVGKMRNKFFGLSKKACSLIARRDEIANQVNSEKAKSAVQQEQVRRITPLVEAALGTTLIALGGCRALEGKVYIEKKRDLTGLQAALIHNLACGYSRLADSSLGTQKKEEFLQKCLENVERCLSVEPESARDLPKDPDLTAMRMERRQEFWCLIEQYWASDVPKLPLAEFDFIGSSTANALAALGIDSVGAFLGETVEDEAEKAFAKRAKVAIPQIKSWHQTLEMACALGLAPWDVNTLRHLEVPGLVQLAEEEDADKLFSDCLSRGIPRQNEAPLPTKADFDFWIKQAKLLVGDKSGSDARKNEESGNETV